LHKELPYFLYNVLNEDIKKWNKTIHSNVTCPKDESEPNHTEIGGMGNHQEEEKWKVRIEAAILNVEQEEAGWL
jgi:hypothetical protein